MKKVLTLSLLVLTYLSTGRNLNAAELIDQKYPIGEPGLKLTYNLNVSNLPASVVKKIELSVGSTEEINGITYQWLQLIAEKINKQTYFAWILAS